MGKNREVEGSQRSRSLVGFDQVFITKVDGTKTKVNDISRFHQNSEARYRQDATIVIANNYPAAHVVGKLVDGVYAAGALKQDSIVREATVVVLEPFDKPVVISLGTPDNPKKFLADFDATVARGTIQVTKDCNTFVDKFDDVIATVVGTDGGVAGKIAIVLDVSKLGASTLMPSN